MSYSQLNKLKLGIKNNTKVTLNLSPNVIGDSNHETDFPHKLFSTDKQVWRLCKAFADNSLTNLNLLKTDLSRMVQLENLFVVVIHFGFLSSPLGIANSFQKEFESKVIPKPKKDSQKLFVNAGLNILGKKIKKDFQQLYK